MVYNFLDKKYSGTPLACADISATKSEITSNQQLSKELHKPIRKFQKWKVYSFKENIWGADLADMQLTTKHNKGLYVLIMSHTHFRVNPHSIVAWMSRNSLLKTGAKSEVWVTPTRTHSLLVRKWTLNHLAKLAKWLSVCLQTKWLWVQVLLQSLNSRIFRRSRSSI